MRYVKIEPHADCPASPCGRLLYVECGLPCENGHPPKFILHAGEEQYIPAWAAPELKARGHQIVELVDITDGKQTALPLSELDRHDVTAELASAPHQEVDRFLRHHGWHQHLMHHEPAHRPRLLAHIKRETVKNGGAPVAVGHTPFHTIEQLRTKAIELHAARQAKKKA